MLRAPLGGQSSIDPGRLHFCLGGHDLEMVTIRDPVIETLGPEHLTDGNLGWGAAQIYSPDRLPPIIRAESGANPLENRAMRCFIWVFQGFHLSKAGFWLSGLRGLQGTPWKAFWKNIVDKMLLYGGPWRHPALGSGLRLGASRHEPTPTLGTCRAWKRIETHRRRRQRTR